MTRVGGARDAPHLVVFHFDAALCLFLDTRHRHGTAETGYDGTSSLGHMVESLGVPLTEVGGLAIGDRDAAAAERIPAGQPVRVLPVPRPQPLPTDPPRFCLDVHLGTLARRMRLLGLDTAYRNDAGDDDLIRQAAAESRMLLTQDRGLLRRRALPCGAFVRGANPGEHLRDVLDRFAPPLNPWTRCGGCNGLLRPVAKREIEHLLEPGTRRTYDVFARCESCGRPYWRGAHAGRLASIIESAQQVVSDRRARPDPR